MHLTTARKKEQTMTDRPVLEIEITEEMIEAGRTRLFEYSPDFNNEDDVVSSIFRDNLAISLRDKAVSP